MHRTDITISRLDRVPWAVPELVRWFVREWAPYYRVAGPGDADADLRQALTNAALPVCLVALSDVGEPIGTASLKRASVSHAHLGPWVAALLVPPAQRGRGLGLSLLVAIEEEARRQGFERLYMSAGGAETDLLSADLENRGWRAFDEASTLRGTVDVFELRLGEASDTAGRATVRERLLDMLRGDAHTALELSRALRVPEKDVYHHLEHVEKSATASGRRFIIDPAMCVGCGYSFQSRRRVRKPGKCPECSATRISPPRFRVD
jgi:predicted Zn-ribbon and HTH transcriptional regulator/GNAT superfamily N-acetyltransferase